MLTRMGSCRMPGNYPTRTRESSQRIANVTIVGCSREPHLSDVACLLDGMMAVALAKSEAAPLRRQGARHTKATVTSIV